MLKKTKDKKSAGKEKGEILELTTKNEIRFNKLPYKFTPKQVEYIKKILDPKSRVIFLCGSAGSSKTILAAYCGLRLMQNEESSGIMYIRAAVESASKGLGFMPDSYQSKLSHYLYPLEEKLDELIVPSDKAMLLKNGSIEGAALNFLRGRTINKTMILDEANQLTLSELETVLTRLGKDEKLILCGDFRQKDIKNSGFEKVVNMFDDDESRYHGFEVLRFTEEDVVRSEAVKFVVKKFSGIS